VLQQFLVDHRDAIIARTRAWVAARPAPRASEVELTNGVPLFLDQLGEALRLASATGAIDHAEITQSASRHGGDLFRMGLTIAQVVHDYGDVCQAITELAVAQRAPISGEEFRTLNLCLDDAIAEAVTEYARQRERVIKGRGTERLGVLAHELRNLLTSATLSFESIKSGRVAVGGSTGLLHGRSLLGLCNVIDRSLAEVRLDAGIDRFELISVAAFIEDLEVGAVMQATARGLHLHVTPVDRALSIEGDPQVLSAAVANLLQNAFKFTSKPGTISLTTRSTAERVVFEIEDECGGLPLGRPEDLFRPFEQRGRDRTGVGLGLAICMKAAKANNGELRVRDIPGKGCVFTLDLPRKWPPPWTVLEGGKVAPESPAGRGGEPAPATDVPKARVG
jgi:signal transduction histidine kinase